MTDQETSLRSYLSDLVALEEHIRMVMQAEREARSPLAVARASRQLNARAEALW